MASMHDEVSTSIIKSDRIGRTRYRASADVCEQFGISRSNADTIKKRGKDKLAPSKNGK